MVSKDRLAGCYYWLIVKRKAAASETFSMGLGEQECLLVFSFSGEAEMFLKLRGLEDDWETRQTGSGELLSMLFSNLSGVGRVALDPLPEILDNDDMLIDLVSISRRDFMNRLLLHGEAWSAED